MEGRELIDPNIVTGSTTWITNPTYDTRYASIKDNVLDAMLALSNKISDCPTCDSASHYTKRLQKLSQIYKNI